MIHLRVIVAGDQADLVVDRLRETPGVAHLIRLPGGAVLPDGDVVMCDVAREAANSVVEWLQHHDVHRSGSISIDTIEAVVSDAAAHAELNAPGEGGDALIWEQLEARVREDSAPTVSFLLLMVIASVIAVVGILLDSPILIVGAMVVGPEYGPLAAACVGVARRRGRPASEALGLLFAGLAGAALAACVATLAIRATGVGPGGYGLTSRELTAFIAHPDALAAVVAILAGVVGMLALTQARSGALVGVLVSVTTIPAAANIGAAAAFGEWTELLGATTQLVVNLAGLLTAGVVTLLIQNRSTAQT